MGSNMFKARFIKSGLAASVLLLAGAAAHAQQVINLTAGPSTATLPDGTAVPMWGYTCGTAAGGTTTATCTALNPAVQAFNVTNATNPALLGTLWSPVVITVPVATAGATSLTINLTNNLSFLPTTAGASANAIPTSLTIVGQLGGGLGTPTSVASPAHGGQSLVTWSMQTGATWTPPPQGNRVQSFGTEVSAVAATTVPAPTCTAAAAGSATPVPGCATLTWSNLQPGTYLIESGTHPSIQGPMGLYGVLVVTTAPTALASGTAYPAVGTTPAVIYGAELPLLFGEIDPVQNNAVAVAVNTNGFNETTVWSGQVGGCGNTVIPTGVPVNALTNTCYPPAVNYLPVYYTINGVAFNRTNPTASLFAAVPNPAVAASCTPVLPATSCSGTVLVRLVNAGLKMHVPSIVNSQTTGFGDLGASATVNGFTLIAEDGNPVPGAPHVQTAVFMAAGKTYDVMVNVPAAGSTALPVYDRELSLSGNQIDRDTGMLAYVGVNSSALPAGGAFGASGTGVAATANPDTYSSVIAGQTLTVADPGKGVLGNDVNVFGAKISLGTATTVGGAAATTLLGTNGTLTLMSNGTFTYAANTTAPTSGQVDVFSYCGNGTTSGAACSTITLNAATPEASSGITCANSSYNAATASSVAVKPPGVLANCKDAAGYPLTATTFTAGAGLSVVGDAAGGFTATASAACTTVGGCPLSFTFLAKNSQGTTIASAVTATVTFPAGSGLKVTVLDGSDKTKQITDYRWVIEEDRTFFVDPRCTTNPPPASCPTANIPGLGTTTGIVPSLGLNFHTSYMPYVAQGCTGLKSCEYGQTVLGLPAVCDVGNGVCRTDTGNGTTSGGFTWVDPSQIALDPTKRYYLSVFPGDAADPFYGANSVGHGMGGTPIPAVSCEKSAAGTSAVCTWPATGATCPATVNLATGAITACAPAMAVTALTQPSPYQTAELSVFVFEDDAPLNGEHDSTGGAFGVNSNLEPGLGQFQIHLWDAMGGNGDFTGQMGFDMFNQPLSNGLAGTKDPLNGNDACPIVNNPLQATSGTSAAGTKTLSTDPTATGLTGFIVTCPEYESDGVTPSPLAGQAVIHNLMPGRWGVIATPGADRIARGEEWLQTNTLDGQKAHDSFTRIGEPSYFQEYGPASFHVSIGFANPAIINARKGAVCGGTDQTGLGPYQCNNTLTGRVVGERLSRTPDERLYGSGSYDAFAWTQCYVSFGDPDSEDFAFTKCAADGTWTLTGLPDGDWRITVFDQWNDMLVDGLSTPVRLSAGATPTTTNVGDIATTQWETNLQTRTFIDDNRDGLSQANETGIPFANVAVRLRDGSLENLLVTDFTGTANFNETFPLFSWYTVETDVTRYKNTGTHVVYDVGGPADNSVFNIGGTNNACTPGGSNGYPPCGTSKIASHLANTAETISVPTNLRVPGAIYCADADCTGMSMQAGSTSANPSSCTTATTPPYATTCSSILSSGRIDPPWVGVEGWQGFPGQFSFIEFGKAPYWENPTAGGLNENGGIHGHVVYASTRPFDDPQMLVQTQWTSLIPHVTINLYQEGFAADGVTPLLTLVDTTQTTSWDEWAQGYRSDGMPNMNCPGQGSGTAGSVTPDLFFFSLYNQPEYLDFYNAQHGGAALTMLPNNAQYKCYDGMHNWNQVQPAPYDGQYAFPSVNSRSPTTGKPQTIAATITAISEAGSTATVTTSTTHGLVSGALVTIAGAPTGYNSADPANQGASASAKLFAISVTGPKNFTYTIPTTGLGAGTAGSVTAPATNCTICVPDPVPASGSPDADAYRAGLAMLPIGKYVVEVVLPPGYELVKEEDKNILIGDNFIAPVTQQFGGMGNVFIMPDQASVATAYTWAGVGYNANSNNGAFNNGVTTGNPAANGNGLNLTQSFGANPENSIVPAFIPEPVWPCVGELRVVPDYISLFPQSHQVAPFAGASRHLCDRKEVTLSDQMGAIAKFWLYTSIHVASKFTGGITDDYTSEFDPFSPQFGEKFAPPDLPISLKDFSGTEISRVYADQWGNYDGMTYSTWEVNPPNPTGYSPTMMVFCMNDPGPVLDTRQTVLDPNNNPIGNPTLGQMITDPAFSPGYSQFCYELPFMPGTTQYLDTPVVPTSAFAGAGYNNVDCSYPDSTPAIKEVDGDQIGPWVSGSGSSHTLTITALGDQMVPNNAYSGPSATAAPYNQKTIRRHYGFGNSQTGTAVGGGATNGSVTIGGVVATVNSWSDSQIVVQVPSGVPQCAVQQQTIYGAPAAPALCGELVITSASTTGGGSVTGVTITRGGHYATAPTVTFGNAPGGGTRATGTANLGPVSYGVASVLVSNGGQGYTANFPVTFTPAPAAGGTAAHGTAVVRRHVTGVTLTINTTHVYTSRPTVVFGGGGGAVATAVMSSEPAGTGTVVGINITNPGSYANNGNVITVQFEGGGSTSTNRTRGTATMTGFVSSVTLGGGGGNTGGSGYSSAPTPVFAAGSPPGNGATGTATLSAVGTASVVSVTLTNGGGSGYTTAPSVNFSCSGAQGCTQSAQGTTTISGPAQTVAGRTSVDTVTVTVGGKAPTHVLATGSIQAAIDAAAPGDLIIVDPTCATSTGPGACTAGLAGQAETTAAHNEILIMWKPVRLQGVGAASSVVDATTHPSGDLKLTQWREKIDCLFGLGINGSPILSAPAFGQPANSYDPANQVQCPWAGVNANTWTGYGTAANQFNPQVDRLPLEAVVGWTSELNGNLAELLQEPALMGALEGAAVTVLGKGVNFTSSPYDPTLLMGFPTGTQLLQNTMTNPTGATCLDATGLVNPFPSNFSCNPSSIDGLTLTQSSQGGGGIFAHGWNHNLQVGNNRIISNAGTLAGGINLGQGEFAPSYIQGSATNAAPGSCEESPVAGVTLPYCQNVNVNIHNNNVSLNSSTGDELFSATPAGNGGVSICTGADYYKFNYNWVCGNLSSGDGGGLGHLGFSSNGDIEHNTIIFNQSLNPTIPANGGGILVMGTPDVDVICPLGNGITPANPLDLDCPFGSQSNIIANAYTPSDGTGPGLVINANLIMGNAAEAGTGGGIAFNAVNGADMVAFPEDPGQWNSVTVTNNIIVDNVAGWDGGGISLLDSPNVNIVNNTIAYNNSTASAGVLFNTLGGPLASQQGPTCTSNCGSTTAPQVAGVVALQNSALLTANLAALPVICPTGHYQGTGANAATNGACRSVSYPLLANNIIWQNASYYISTGALSSQFQQNVISMFNAFANTAAANQTTTGGCVTAGNQYWDVGVRGDTAPGNNNSTYELTVTDSVLTAGGSTVLGGGNSPGNPNFVNFYCDGSRQPPEFGASGWAVPSGISDATVPNPIFNLTPVATVDEGNNWVNLRWGPLSMSNPSATGGAHGNYGGGLPLGNYAIRSGSSAAGRVTGANMAEAPRYDFFDRPRTGGSTDAGAVRLTGTVGRQLTVSAAVIDFGSVPDHSPTTIDQDVVLTNSDIAPVTITNAAINCTGVAGGTCSAASFSLAPAGQPDYCAGPLGAGVTLGAGQSCMLTVVFNPGTTQAVRNANLAVTAGGVTTNVSLTGVDSLAAATASAITPALTATPANTAAVVGTITVTNNAVLCVLGPTSTSCPAGSSPYAGPYIPTAITLTQTGGTGTFALGGTCAVGTAINPGATAVPSPPTPAVPSGSCTVTVTYTPPTTGALAGSARLTMTGIGNASTTPIINNVLINAN
jgi:hypothetical protein